MPGENFYSLSNVSLSSKSSGYVPREGEKVDNIVG